MALDGEILKKECQRILIDKIESIRQVTTKNRSQIATPNIVLCIDASIKLYLDILIPAKEIRQRLAIAKIYLLEPHTKPQENCSIVFITRSTLTLTKSIASVLQNWPKNSQFAHHVLWLPKRTSECTLELERLGAMDFIVSMQELPLFLLPCDTNVFTLGQSVSFKDLYLDGNMSILTEIACSILQLESLYNSNCCASFTTQGLMGEKVLTLLDKLRKEKLINSKLTNHANDDVKISQFFLIDRMEDLFSIFMTPLHYEGVIDSILGLNHGFVDSSIDIDQIEFIKSEIKTNNGIIVLNEKADELYGEIRNTDFNLLTNGILLDIATSFRSHVKVEKEKVTEETNRISDLSNLVAKLPAMTSKKKSLAIHVNLIEKLIKSNRLKLNGKIIEMEMQLVYGTLQVNHTSPPDEVEVFVEESILRNPPLPIVKLLRFMCLYSLLYDGIKEKKLDWFRRQLVHTYGFKVLKTLLVLEKLNLLLSKEKIKKIRHSSSPKKRKFSSLRRSFALLNGILTEESILQPKDISFMFPYTGYASLSIRQVQYKLGLIHKNWEKVLNNTADFLTPNSGNDSSKGTKINESNQGTICLYFIGGVSPAELAAVRFLNVNQKKYNFIVATTGICNSDQIIASLV